MKGFGFQSVILEKNKGTSSFSLYESLLCYLIFQITSFFSFPSRLTELIQLKLPIVGFQKIRVYIQLSQFQQASGSPLVSICHCPIIGRSILWPKYLEIDMSRPSDLMLTSIPFKRGSRRLFFWYLLTSSTFHYLTNFSLCFKTSLYFAGNFLSSSFVIFSISSKSMSTVRSSFLVATLSRQRQQFSTSSFKPGLDVKCIQIKLLA